MIQKIIPSNFTILVVEDDVYIHDMIRLYLENQGFHLFSAYSGKEALHIFQTDTIHLIILDLMLPEINGWEVCKTIREQSEMPILILTAKGESEDKVEGLNLGADDYIIKPFDPNELIARIYSLLRRSYHFPNKMIPMSYIKFGNLNIDTAGRVVTINRDIIELTHREYQLLLIFARHPNQVLDRQQLLDMGWGEDFIGDDRVVDVYVTRLRQKLSVEDSLWKIETIRGIGYKMKVEA